MPPVAAIYLMKIKLPRISVPSKFVRLRSFHSHSNSIKTFVLLPSAILLQSQAICENDPPYQAKRILVILNSGLILILKSCFLIKIFDRWWIRECGTNTVKFSFIWSACAHILVINGRLVAQWHIWQCCPWVATSRSYWSSLQCQWYTYSVA